MKHRDLLHIVLREHAAGRRVAICAVVATRGSTPQPPGALIVVDEAANVFGTLGGGCMEADVRRQAHEQLGQPAGRLATFELDHDFGYDDGMICGGSMDVAIHPVGPGDDVAALRAAVEGKSTDETTIRLCVARDGVPVEYRVRLQREPRLIIAGAGHISRVLSDMAVKLGFAVHVVDDRAEHAHARRFPPPIALHVGDIAETLASLDMDGDAFVVIVTRGHQHDEAALRAVIDAPARYIGMIGSRRKIQVVYDDLRHDGVSESRLARVHAPIGLDIGAVSTEEIALSIAAELVKERRSAGSPRVEGPFPIPDRRP
jgi:xanthine dehydrogenase accessory factor